MLNHVHAAQGHLGQLGSFAGQDEVNRNFAGLDQMLQAPSQPGNSDYSAGYAGIQHAISATDTKVGIAKVATDAHRGMGLITSAAAFAIANIITFLYKPELSRKVLASKLFKPNVS